VASINERDDRLPLGANRPIGEMECARSAAPSAVMRRAGWRRAWLTVRVHVDAIAHDPANYAAAVLWLLRGYKVRSRNRFAPLLGRSPRAYDLWMARHEGADGKPSAVANSPMIVPVIDCRDGDDGLDATLASIGRAGVEVRPVLIGGVPVAGTARVDRPSELEQFCESALWLCPLRCGDLLADQALAHYARLMTHNASSLLYADDDLIREGRCEPHFKPQWNPDLFEHHDFLTGASIVRASSESLRALPDEEWAEALVAGAAGETAPTHVPLVLHHRASRPAPRRPSAPLAPMHQPLPLVSVIIPTRNQLALLRTCVEGLARRDYPQVETIVVDNGSDDRATIDYLAALERNGCKVLRIPGPFNFSRLNNAAVSEARGDLLCFLNNDVEMVENDWLGLLVRQAVRDDLGAVGARLLYPDGTVQHAGVFTGIGGGAGHGHRFQAEDDAGYFDRARLPQQVSAVTAACLVVKRAKFLAVGGFDEVDFPVAFNDVDLCLKLNAHGWQSFYEPRAMLIHHESKSRGSDAAKSNRVRFAGELAALKRKWHTDSRFDPFHHPHLSRFSEQFLVAV
jgi:GT2 family glycosyltransferase